MSTSQVKECLHVCSILFKVPFLLKGPALIKPEIPQRVALESISHLLVPRNRLWRDKILPRLVLPLFWVSALAVFPAWVIGRSRRSRRDISEPSVAVECGIVGWTMIEFLERFESLVDYVGDVRAVRQVIDREKPYFPQFSVNQSRDRVTHIVLDMRTPPQSWFRGGFEAFRVSLFAHLRGITLIVFLPDLYYRRLRWHAAVLTAFNGVVVTLVDPSTVKSLFPHSRILGPAPMPISVTRLEWLERCPRNQASEVKVVFIGHVYPPRSDFLEALKIELECYGIKIQVLGDKWNTSNEDYWRTLVEADIVLNTGFQGPDRRFVDHIWVVHMVYRVHEVLAAGAALVTSRVKGADLFFSPGVDFLEFDSVSEAAEHIRRLVSDRDFREATRAAGHAASRRIILERLFWHSIDSRLHPHSRIEPQAKLR